MASTISTERVLVSRLLNPLFLLLRSSSSSSSSFGGASHKSSSSGSGGSSYIRKYPSSSSSSSSKPSFSTGTPTFLGGNNSPYNGRSAFASMWESISSQSSGSPDFSPADGPTLTYWIKDTLYVAVTNRCNTVPLHATRGPSFSLGDFRPLPPSFEPTEDELLTAVSGALAASHSLLNKEWTEVCFAGWGEPTLRWPTVLTVAECLRKGNRSQGGRGGGSEGGGGGGGGGLRLRLNTNGLGNVAQQRKIVKELAEAFESVTVAVNTADAIQYDDLMHPDLTMRAEAQALRPYLSFSSANEGGTEGGKEGGKEGGTEGEALAEVLSFVKECVEAGVKTQVTAVARPDVDIEAVRALAKGMGADFRLRPYFE